MIKDYNKVLQEIICNSNYRCNLYTKNIFSKFELEQFMYPAFQLLNKVHDITKDRYYSELEQLININLNIKTLVDKLQLVPGIVITYGNMENARHILYGKSSILGPKMDTETIFDLASVTKIFTLVAYLQLVDKKICSLSDPIGKYSSKYFFIKNITIEELLSFKVNLRTDERINADISTEKAYFLIQQVKNYPLPDNGRFYSDIPALILGNLFKEICGISLGEYIEVNILNPCQMNSSFYYEPDKELLSHIVNYDKEYRLRDGILNIKRTPIGIAHDEKAQALIVDKHTLTGHAGLFASAKDMTLFAQKLLARELISDESLQMIGINRTGKKISNDKYSQFLGLLSYSKHCNVKQSEVFFGCSGNSFSMTGYTGTFFGIDPNNNLFEFIGTNRVSERMTQYPEELEINNHLFFDGKEYICTKNYVFIRDKLIRDCCMKLGMQWLLY